MTSSTSSGFGRMAGSIAAIVAAIVLAVLVYYAWTGYHKTNNTTQNTIIITDDSLRRAVAAKQKAGDAALAALRDTLAHQQQGASMAVAQARSEGSARIGALTAQLHRSDSLLDLARTRADSDAARATAAPISLDSAIALVTQQVRVDSAAITQQTVTANTCSVALLACAAGRVRADSIAGFWESSYKAEKAKSPTKFQQTAATVGEVTDVALILFAIIKYTIK